MEEFNLDKNKLKKWIKEVEYKGQKIQIDFTDLLQTIKQLEKEYKEKNNRLSEDLFEI